MSLCRSLRADINRYDQQSLFPLRLLVALSKLGFWAVVVYRFGSWLRQKTRGVPVLRELIWGITGLQKLIIEIICGVSIPFGAQIGEGLLIAHFSNIMVSDAAVIGRNCTLHQGVTIGKAEAYGPGGAPTIGDNFFAGANCVVIGRVQIGNDVIVGAGTVCCFDVPSGSTVVSQKARVLNGIQK